MKRHNWAAGFLLTFVVLGGATAFVLIVRAHGSDAEPPSSHAMATTQPTTRPDAEPMSSGEPTDRTFFPATIEAFEMADLHARASGYIETVKVDIGDHVKSGQVLATIDNPEMRDDLREAQATLAAKKELLASADKAVGQAMQAMEVARKRLGSFEATKRLADITLKRQQELFAGQAATNQQIDETRAKADIATADADVARARIAAAEADLEAAKGARSVAAAQAEVAGAQVQRIQTLLHYLDVVAPFDGVITRRLVDRGRLVQATTPSGSPPLFTCQRFDEVRVFCQVPEAVAAHVKVGDKVVLKVFGLNWERFDAQITRISRAINPQTRTMRIEIDLPNPGERLRPGMYSQVTLLSDIPATRPMASRTE